MATKGPGKKPAKVFDVTKPGLTPADPSSRPIIVGHKKTIQEDPMVVPADTSNDEVSLTAPSENKPKAELSVARANAPEEPVEAEAESEVDGSDVEATEAEATISETESDEPQEEEEVGVNPALVSDLIQNVNTKKEQSIADEEKAKRDQHISELVTSKKYFVKTRLPKGKRHMRLVLIFLLLAVLAASWFALLGPGKDMIFSQSSSSTQADAAPAAVSPAAPSTVKAELPPKTFNDPKYGISFMYPADWAVDTAPDAGRPGVTVITLSSPKLTTKTAYKEVEPVDVEVFLRTQIYVQPTSAQGAGLQSVCSTETIQIDAKSLNVAFVLNGNDGPSVGQATVVEGNCLRSGERFAIDSELELSKSLPDSEYQFTSEYIYTTEHLRKLGSTTPEQIAAGQVTGIVTKKDDFKATESYKQLVEVLKSIKSL